MVNDLDFSVIYALRGLQAAQKSHVEFTSQQALLSEEQHINLMQKLCEATGKMTLLAKKLKTLMNFMLQPYGGLTDQSFLNIPDFSYLVNPPDLSFFWWDGPFYTSLSSLCVTIYAMDNQHQKVALI